MPRPSDPLPRALAPLAGEGLPGLVLRLAHRLDLAPVTLLARTGLHGPSTTFVAGRVLLSLEERLAPFARSLRLTAAEAAALTLAPDGARYPAIADSLADRSPRHLPYDAWVFTHFTRYCPQCLAGDGSAIQRRHGGPWKIRWRLPVVFTCPEHQVYLCDRCPACTRPAHAFDGGACRLLPMATVGGLHPAQCRNPVGGHTGPRRMCGMRLDTAPPGPAPDPAAWRAQQRVHVLLDSSADALEAVHHVTGLRVLAAVVQATWPRGRDFGLTGSSDAFEQHVDHLRRLAADRNDRRRLRWDTPPPSATATATLLQAADTMLNLEQDEFRDALATMLPAGPPAGAVSWGRTWDHLRTHAAVSLRREFDAAHLNRPGARARIRGPRPGRSDVGYRPENIPQQLPDAWAACLPTTPRTRHVLARRAAAIRLVQLASGMDVGEATAFLGIPHAWLLADERRPWSSLPRDLFAHDDALAPLTAALAATPGLPDYRHRRTSLHDWTLPAEEWQAILGQLPPRVQRTADTVERMRQTASEFIWTRVTGSEPALAPHIPHVTSSRWLRHVLARSAGRAQPNYLKLRQLLDEYATCLALRVGHA